MKIIISKGLLVMLIGLFSIIVNAQSNEAYNGKKAPKPNVPAAVKQAFAKEFPSSKASWGAEGDDFEAEFKLSGEDASATYSKEGHRKALEVVVKATELPEGVLDYVTKNFPQHNVIEVAKITDDKNVVTYEVEIGLKGKSWDVLFDATGKFIEKEEGD